MQVPCLDCPDRAVGCHGKCERYKAWQEYKEADALAAYVKKYGPELKDEIMSVPF